MSPFFSAQPASGDDHRRRAAVEAGRIAGGDGAVLAEGGPQLGKAFDRGVRAVVLVLLEEPRLVPLAQLDRHDLVRELAGGLRRREALLRAFSPAVLLLARDLAGIHQILRMPAGMLVGEGVVEAVAQHAVVNLAVAQPIAPAPATHQVRARGPCSPCRPRSRSRLAEHDLLRRRGDGLGARAADAVDRHRRHLDRQPA